MLGYFLPVAHLGLFIQRPVFRENHPYRRPFPALVVEVDLAVAPHLASNATKARQGPDDLISPGQVVS